MIDGAKLTYYMKVRRMSNPQLAEAAGVTDKSISDYRNGRYSPKLATLQKIATHLGVKVDDLLKRDGDDGQI